MRIVEFVYAGCEATKDIGGFVENWFLTDRNPCTKCGADKAKCNFYHVLLARGEITEGYP